MPTARELLHQVDALMRRNRSSARDDIPVLTEAIAPEVAAQLTRGGALSESLAEPSERLDRPTELDSLDDVPVLTEAVEEVAAPSALDPFEPEGEHSAWLDYDDDDDYSIIDGAADSIVKVADAETPRSDCMETDVAHELDRDLQSAKRDDGAVVETQPEVDVDRDFSRERRAAERDETAFAEAPPAFESERDFAGESQPAERHDDTMAEVRRPEQDNAVDGAKVIAADPEVTSFVEETAELGEGINFEESTATREPTPHLIDENSVHDHGQNDESRPSEWAARLDTLGAIEESPAGPTGAIEQTLELDQERVDATSTLADDAVFDQTPAHAATGDVETAVAQVAQLVISERFLAQPDGIVVEDDFVAQSKELLVAEDRVAEPDKLIVDDESASQPDELDKGEPSAAEPGQSVVAEESASPKDPSIAAEDFMAPPEEPRFSEELEPEGVVVHKELASQEDSSSVAEDFMARPDETRGSEELLAQPDRLVAAEQFAATPDEPVAQPDAVVVAEEFAPHPASAIATERIASQPDEKNDAAMVSWFEPWPLSVGTPPDLALPARDDAQWAAMAEEVHMQVLQRIDLFTDTGLRDKLGVYLQPIVDRASAELITTINREVGELLRAYIAEAIEREIARWRQDRR